MRRRFILTSSANAMMIPNLADALAGRSEVISLLPLSQCEIRQIPSTFLNTLLQGEAPRTKEIRVRETLIENVLGGGFPEPLSRANEQRRINWYTHYINNTIQKDLKDLGDIAYIKEMPKLISLLANQVSHLTNHTELAGRIGISRQTMTRYLALLEQLYLFESLPAWHANASKRLIKSSKLHMVDSGLLAALKRITLQKCNQDPGVLGALLESYIFCELRRLATWCEVPLYFYHYRDKDKVEVDIVLETSEGKVIGIEVKAAATINRSDFQGLNRLQSIVGDDFLIGIILYDGDHTISHGDKLYSVPISTIWG